MYYRLLIGDNIKIYPAIDIFNPDAVRACFDALAAHQVHTAGYRITYISMAGFFLLVYA